MLGGVRTLEELLEMRPAGRVGRRREPSETTRLGRLARRLWDGLLGREEMRAR